MIADWTVEVGPDSPSIDVPWEGWADLRSHPELADALGEAVLYPELLPLLRGNNAVFLTSKIDVFTVSRDEVDPELAEENAEAATAYGLGSYLDCLCARLSFSAGEQAAHAAVLQLRALPLPRAVVEVVIRPARLYDEETFGWTLYAIGFGLSAHEARQRWSETAQAAFNALQAGVQQAHSGRATAGE